MSLFSSNIFLSASLSSSRPNAARDLEAKRSARIWASLSFFGDLPCKKIGP
jgi:hypothetical protein